MISTAAKFLELTLSRPEHLSLKETYSGKKSVPRVPSVLSSGSAIMTMSPGRREAFSKIEQAWLLSARDSL